MIAPRPWESGDHEARWNGYLIASDSPVLVNKFGITIPEALQAAENDLVEARVAELRARPSLVPRTYDLAHLKSLHLHLLQDVYEWAGDLRTVGIAKGEGDDTSFMPPFEIERPVTHVADRIAPSNRLRTARRAGWTEYWHELKNCYSSCMHPGDVDRVLALPSNEAVEHLVSLPEDQWFERKAGRISARELAVPLVAMANAEGGYVAVGIHDGTVDGVAAPHLNPLRQTAQDFTTPVVRCAATELATTDGKIVLILRVDPGEHVHETTKGDVYLRVGDESRKLGYAQRKELEYDRGSAPFDGTSADVDVADLDGDQVAAYQESIGAATPEGMLTARDLLTRDGRLTVAGWLLFGERPQSLFPSAVVRVLHYADTERGVGAAMTLYEGGDIRCEGSIPEQIAKAAEVIDKWVPRVQALASSGRFEPRPIIPRDVWLEGLVNAVLHRSYSMAGDHVRVEIFPNRIEIENPGRFPGLADPSKPLSISRYARNPRVVRVCSDLGIARELGEGIKRIFGEMRSLGLTDPIYSQTSGSVRLVLSSADALPEDIRASLPKAARKVLDTLRLEGRPMSTGQIAELADISRPTASRHLQALRKLELVAWDGQGPKDPRASWTLR